MFPLTADSKLEFLRRHRTRYALAKELPVDPQHLTRIARGEATVGPELAPRVADTFHRFLNKRYGAGDVVWPWPAQRHFDQFRKTLEKVLKLENPAGRIRDLYNRDFAWLQDLAGVGEGDDFDTALRKAGYAAIKGHLEATVAPYLLKTTHHDPRSDVIRSAWRTFQDGAAALRAKGGPLPNVAYLRINSLGVMSEYRAGAGRADSLVVFKDAEVVAAIDGDAIDDIRTLLATYRLGHPHRLVVASNQLVMGSLLKKLDIALEGWRTMVEEDCNCRDLGYHAKDLKRPLDQSPDTLWLREQIGLDSQGRFILPKLV